MSLCAYVCIHTQGYLQLQVRVCLQALLVTTRSLSIQKCRLPAYSNSTFCSMLPKWTKQLQKDLQLLEEGHQVRLNHAHTSQAAVQPGLALAKVYKVTVVPSLLASICLPYIAMDCIMMQPSACAPSLATLHSHAFTWVYD